MLHSIIPTLPPKAGNKGHPANLGHAAPAQWSSAFVGVPGRSTLPQNSVLGG
jgi:hypothetical protein